MDNSEVKTKKKKAKKVRPPKPVYNEFVYSPSLQTTKPATAVVGFIGRAITVYIAVLGMTLFLTDAFKVEINIPALMLTTLLIVGVFAVMSINRRTFLCGLGVSAVTAAILAFASGNPLSAFMNSVGTLWNHMLDRLDFVGYKISPNIYLPVDTTTIFTETETAAFMFWGVTTVTVLFAVIFSASIMKRVRMLPILIVSAAVITTVFTYNISSSNWGFTLILTAAAGIITLKIYDGIYNRPKPAKDIRTNSSPARSVKTSAYGGAAGLVTMALSFIVLLVPTLTCKEQWTTIGFINDKMEYGRALVSSVILGETPDVDLGYIGNMDTLNSRSTTATERAFTGREMLKVYASYNMPLYVRSWIASAYSNDDDAWVSVSSSKAAQYSSWFYNGFTPEVINYNFLNLLNPKNTNINSFTSYSNHIENGYITETIDIQNLNSRGNLLFTAATYNPSYGLLNFLSTDRADLYKGEWKFYYEGIVTSSWFNLEKQYRMTAFVPSYRYETYSDSVANNLQYYSLMKYFITQYADISTNANEEADAVKSAKDMLDYYGVTYDEPIALERYFAQDDAGRENFLYTYFTLPDYYQSFVLNEYLSVPESKYLSDIAAKITSDYLAQNNGISSGVYVDDKTGETAPIYSGSVTEESERHNVVLAVIDYLKENYRYTLTPKEPKNSRNSALDAFLGDTKEGYCVQFATSAAMILREMGIPTRYCEGYLVNKLKYDKSPDRLAKYSQIVRDYNAHAWIEVYMGAAGWMTYETTPEYYSDLYEPYLSSSGSVSYTPPEDIDVPETTPYIEEEIIEEPKETTGFKFSAKTLFTILISVVIAGLIALPIWMLVRLRGKAVRAYEKRYAALNRAMQSQLTDEEIRETGRELNDYIWQLHTVAGIMPERGELPAEYCARVDDNINASLFSFKDILGYMNREEFGYGMARWQLREEAEYVQILWEKLQKSMTTMQRLRYSFFKRMA